MGFVAIRRHRLALGFLVAVLLGLATGAWRLASSWRFERGLEWAEREVRAGRYREARRWLAGLPPSRFRDSEAAYWLGVCEHAEGHFEAALAAWARVPPDSPRAALAESSRAKTLLIDLGRFAEAERALERLVEHPGSEGAEARRILYQLYYWEGRADAMRRLIRRRWGRVLGHAAELRELWMMDGAPPRVVAIREAVDRAAKSAPDDDRVRLARAYLATQTGRFAEAARDLDACLAHRPDDPAVWLARLEWGRSSGNPLEVERALPHLRADILSEAETLDLRAWLAAQRGDLRAERLALEELVERSPGDARALDRLAAIAWESGRKDLAADLRRRKADVDQARERYRTLLAHRAEAESYVELAGLAGALGRRFEAEGWLALAAMRGREGPAIREARSRLRGLPDPPSPPADQTLADRLLGGGVGSTGRAATPVAEGKAGARAAFTDDAEAVGLRFVFDSGRSRLRQMPETMSGGLGLLDYDGDGWLDVYLLQGGPFPPDPARPGNGDRLYRNKGDGSFEDVTGPSGIGGMAGGYGHGVRVGDYDDDGHPDLFVTRWRSYSLYRNKGDGTFEDATAGAGLDGDRDWPTSAAFADLDGDGDLDLYVCHYLDWDEEDPKLCPFEPIPGSPPGTSPDYRYCVPKDYPALPDHLFRNDRGRFIDVSEEAGIVDRDGRGLGVVAADLDDDGKVDLFVANDTTANSLFHNLGNMRFEEVGLAAGVACNAAGAFQAGMGVAAGDLDGDGRIDLAVTNFYGESTTFFRNLGRGMFADQTRAVGLASPSRFLLGFGIAFLDANSDGRLDLMTANGHVIDGDPGFPYAMPAQLLVGGEGGRLTEVVDAAVAPLRAPRVGRGLAVGDLDNDGRTDALLLSQNSPLAYFHNRTRGGHWLTLRLEGTASGRDAVGARVVVTVGGRRQTAQRVGGGSYQSAGDPRLSFGLGADVHIDAVEVRWPSGSSDTYRSLPADSGYLLREGEREPKSLVGFKHPARSPQTLDERSGDAQLLRRLPAGRSELPGS